MPETQTVNKKYFKVSVQSAIFGGLFLILIIGLSFKAGYYQASALTKKIVTGIHPVRENNGEYNFIYPLLLYNFGDAKKFFEDTDLEKKLNTYIESQYKNKTAQNISVSVRDFSKSRWSGVGQDQQYHPGSMMKVIIMLGYFKQAETNSEILNKELTYSKTVDQQSSSLDFNLPSSLLVGQKYSVANLLKAMIGNSDNGAANLLLDNISNKLLDQVYSDLSIKSPDEIGDDYTISTNQYTDFLRILYNSTYLTEQYSEQALSIMSQSNYKEGLSAGVPQGVPVAQKYGERVDASNGQIQAVELSDCGVVYPQNHPYALCVMTKKSATSQDPANEKQLASIIKDISEIVYNEVNGE